MDNKKCAVCYTNLSFPYDDNCVPLMPDHFHFVCLEHKKYATTFLIDVVAENLGFKDVEERECEVCGKKLDKKQVQKRLAVNGFHFLCEKHFKYSKEFMLPNERNMMCATNIERI